MTEQHDNVVYMSDFKKEKKNRTGSDTKKSKSKDKVKKQKDRNDNAIQTEPMNLFESPVEFEKMIADMVFGQPPGLVFQDEPNNGALSNREKEMLFLKYEIILGCFNRMIESVSNKTIKLKDDSPPYEILDYTKNELILKHAKAFTDFSNVELNKLKSKSQEELYLEDFDKFELQMDLNMLRVDLSLELDYRKKIKKDIPLEKMRYIFASKSKKIIANKNSLFTDSMKEYILDCQEFSKEFFDDFKNSLFFQTAAMNNKLLGNFFKVVEKEYIDHINCVENMLEAFKEKDRFKLSQNFLKVLFLYNYIPDAIFMLLDWFEENCDKDEYEYEYEYEDEDDYEF